MSRNSRLRVYQTIIETGLVPVFYHADVVVSDNIIHALLDAGVRVLEFTNRGDQAHIVFEELYCRFLDDPRLILGVGTILDPATAALYIQLGADFVVSPVINPEISRLCNRRKIAYMPGCGSVSEISQAEELGAEIVKVFPGAHVGGPGFVKAVRAPMPWTYIMPTGGVEPNQENLVGWFEAGVAAVGMGSKLVRKDWVAAGDFDKIHQAAKETLSIIQQTRQEYPLNY